MKKEDEDRAYLYAPSAPEDTAEVNDDIMKEGGNTDNLDNTKALDHSQNRVVPDSSFQTKTLSSGADVESLVKNHP